MLVIITKSTLAQVSGDSAILQLSSLPSKYLEQVSSKADNYYQQLTSKTEKALERLCKWEAKVKFLLEKASPETAKRLFSENQISFSVMLQKYREGKVTLSEYGKRYNKYQEDLQNTLAYLSDEESRLNKRFVQPLGKAKKNMARVDSIEQSTQELERLIKERKKQLVEQALKFAGSSKYMKKINKESYYYFESIKNYRQLFSDPKRVEELAVKLLKKVPGFSEFIQKNSMLTALFGTSVGGANPGGTIGLLQSRVSVQSMAQVQLMAATANPQQVFQQSVQSARGELNQLKQQLSKWGGDSDAEVPDFKPNAQRSKTFIQKLEFSANIQSNRPNSLFPVSSELGMAIGFKPNNKFIVGFGGAYRVGWGTSFSNIRISHQGVGLRSFLDWKLKGQFFMSGAYEQNYFSEIRSISQLRDFSSWKSSFLMGVSKKYSIGKKKKGEMKLMYDFFSQTKSPVTSPVVFRIGVGL
jgi:hypothetical protein